MNQDMDDLLGASAKPTRRRRAKQMLSRGPLHDLLTQGLPDFKHPAFGVCDLRLLADEFNMTIQGVYKWFAPGRENRIPSKVAGQLVELSKRQKNVDDDFQPLTHEVLFKYIS